MKRIVIITGILLALLSTGCSVMNAPRLADVPLIDHKGDVRVSASAYVYPILGLEATTTVGVFNRMALQLHVDGILSDTYFHVASGFFLPIENRVFEAYLGYGKGDGSVYVDAEPISARGSFNTLFLQLNYGWKDLGKRHADVGFSLKGGRLFPEFRGSTPNTSVSHYTEEDILIEPQAFVRWGGEHVKFNLQVGYLYLPMLSAFNKSHENLFRYSPFMLSTGVTFIL